MPRLHQFLWSGLCLLTSIALLPAAPPNIIVIMTDRQGSCIGDHGWFDKRWMYEESLKMPFIAQWPGVVAAGSNDNHLI